MLENMYDVIVIIIIVCSEGVPVLSLPHTVLTVVIMGHELGLQCCVCVSMWTVSSHVP